MPTQEAPNCAPELENGDINHLPSPKRIIAVDLDDVLSSTNEHIAACPFPHFKPHHNFLQGWYGQGIMRHTAPTLA